MSQISKAAKAPLILSCYVCAFGAFGAFFRWLQMQAARDAETGLMNPSILNLLVPLTIICAAVVFYLRLKKLLGEGVELPTEFYAALRGNSLLCPAFSWLLCAITVAGGIVTMINVSLDAQRGLYTVIAALGILCGLGFPLVCSAARKRYSPGLVSLIMSLPILMYCLWLIACYRANSNNPNLWVYAVEIVTVCVLIIAFYYAAGFPFGRAKPNTASFFCMLGAFLGIVTLADGRYFGLQLILIGSVGMLLMENWILIRNMREKTEPEPEAESLPEAEPEAAPEPEPEPEAEPTEPVPEPTIEAPARKKAPDAADQRDAEVDEILKEYKKP